MLRLGVCQEWRTSWYLDSNWWRLWSGVESGSLCMTLTDQHSRKEIWWDWMWMATGRSGFYTVVVNRCPFMQSEREWLFMPSTLEKPITPFLTLWMDPGSPPWYWTQTYLLPSTHKLPDSTPDHICRQFETAYQLILQSRHTPGLNIYLTPLNSTLASVALKSFWLRLFYSTAEEGHCDLAESLPFSFHFFSICLSDAHPRAGWRFRLS